MNHRRKLALVAGALASAVLYGCGGGGDSPSVTFPLQAGYRARVTAGSSDNFTATGTCTGTATVTITAARPATFEGITGYFANQTSTFRFSNCTSSSSTTTTTVYYDTNYVLLGASTPGSEYAKYASLSGPFPASVRPGDAAEYGRWNRYSDSTKTTLLGQDIRSYVVEADTSTTAFVTLIVREYNTAGQLQRVTQQKYRIAADGTLTYVSVDVQTSTTHVVFTKT